MHYFSLHSKNQTHIGFFVMTDDDEHETPPQSGQFLVKLQSETPPPTAAAQALAPFCDSENPDIWQLAGDHVALSSADGSPAGRIRNEHLTLGGQTFLLNDLTGVL